MPKPFFNTVPASEAGFIEAAFKANPNATVERFFFINEECACAPQALR